VIRLRLPDGALRQGRRTELRQQYHCAEYRHDLAARHHPNPQLYDSVETGGAVRELTDNEFVTVLWKA